MSNPNLVEEVESYNREGDSWFKSREWRRAEICYSKCIDRLDNIFKVTHDATMIEELKNALMIGYSNRAMTRMELQDYGQQALADADKALEIDPQNVQSLILKGKAAHNLSLFEQACRAFEAAYEKLPHQYLLERLQASTIALEQSFGLSNFILHPTTSNVPSCEDFVGPVEVRRVHYANGGRGLFATRSVKAGNLLLVSSSLAWVAGKAPFHSLGTILIPKLYDKMIISDHKMVQLYSLCSNRNPIMQIPSMELFRPGSEWVPENLGKFKEDAGLIHKGDTSEQEKVEIANKITHDIVRFNAYIWEDRFQRISGARDGIGIWVLPSFTNHSCSPNVHRCFVGDALFFRACVDIGKGQELTTTYLNDVQLFDGVEARRTYTRKRWSFTCNCERCLLEKIFNPQISEIAIRIDLDTFANKVQSMIRSYKTQLGMRQQGWIRAPFKDWYISFDSLKGTTNSPMNRVGFLRLIIETMTSVYITPEVLEMAAELLYHAAQLETSILYQSTWDRVREIYTLEFGNQPTSVLVDLINARLPRSR